MLLEVPLVSMHLLKMLLLPFIEVVLFSVYGIETVLSARTSSRIYKLSKNQVSHLTLKLDVGRFDCAIYCLRHHSCKGFQIPSDWSPCRIYSGKTLSGHSQQNLNKEEMFRVIPEMVKKTECDNSPNVEGSCSNSHMIIPYVCKNHADISTTRISKCKNKVWTEFKLKFADHSRCYELVDGKALYTGNVSVTETGTKCQRWDTKNPHEHAMIAEWFVEESLSDAVNYCRDPDDVKTPWCYTIDSSERWRKCNVPQC